jgi:hypothetical protein
MILGKTENGGYIRFDNDKEIKLSPIEFREFVDYLKLKNAEYLYKYKHAVKTN